MADAIILDMGKDLEGATQIKGYEKKIELFSYSHGVSMQVTNDVSNTERTSGKPMIQDFNVTKYLDKASPKMNQKCCEGAVIAKVIVTVGSASSLNPWSLKPNALKPVMILLTPRPQSWPI